MSKNQIPSPVFLPRRKFQIGDYVISVFYDIEDDEKHTVSGTVFGYQYQHPACLEGDLVISQPGWVYCVVWMAMNGNPYAGYIHEDDLEPARNPNTCKLIQFPRQSLQLQQRTQRYRNLIEAAGSSAVCVTLHDINEGFIYLDVYAPLPERLNQSRELLLGQPASFVDPRIAEPRIHHIKRALANGQVERYSYTYSDSHFWRFNVTVAPIYGSEEVITIVEDAEAWQAGYWINRITD